MALVIALLLLLVLGGRWGLSPRWTTDLTVARYRLRYGDFVTMGSAPRRLDLCAEGHFAQGPVGEVLYRAGLGPTDSSAGDCVTVQFSRELSPGRYRLSGEGLQSIGGAPRSFVPGPGHDPAVKLVALDRSCFCSEHATPARFEGVLTLERLAPPTGRLELVVTPSTGTVTRIDSSLSRFEWDEARAF